MIDEIKTFERFGYHSNDLKPKSKKPVVVECDECGKERILARAAVKPRCLRCTLQSLAFRLRVSAGLRQSWATSRKGWKHSEGTKQKISAAKMGTPAWNKGTKGVFKPTAEHIQKLQDGLRVKGRDARHRQRISLALRGNQNSKGKKWVMSERGRANLIASNGLRGKPAWNKGKSNEWCKGEKNRFWNGGVSKKGYPSEFNHRLKLKIRQRDNFTCQLCGKTEEEERRNRGRALSVNHIDFNKLNCAEDNLNTLCHLCNIHINSDREKWTEYFKEQSCFVTAVA